MERLEIQGFLNHVEKLPTLSGVAMKIVEVANNPKSAADDLSRIIMSDQSLSANILRLVNSAYYGVRTKVCSVKQGIVILGFNTIKSLSLSAAIMDKFTTSGTVEGFSRGEFWKHSFGVAITNKILAKRIVKSRDLEENYFMAGLLHDIGKVILDEYYNEDFRKVLVHMNLTGVSFYEAEMEINGLSHAEIGGMLAGHWQMPEELIAPISFHHNPESQTRHSQMIAATHFADILVKTKGFGCGGDRDISILSEAAVTSLGISAADIFDIVGKEMDEEYDKAGEFLKMMEIDS